MPRYNILVRMVEECAFEVTADNEQQARDLAYDEVAADLGDRFFEASCHKITETLPE